VSSQPVSLGTFLLIFRPSYAVTELQKDVETELLKLPEAEREANQTKFAIFVVHNKVKPKAHELPEDIPYYAGAEVGDVWQVLQFDS
jgi:hypothetical protein